jgi:hemerythrin-like domain-containing protein
MLSGSGHRPKAALVPASLDPFAALRDEHAALEELFAMHQEALLERNWTRSTELLDHYRRSLHRHFEIEERFLLPTYLASGAGVGQATRVYRAEHGRIRMLLDKVSTRLTEALQEGPTARRLIGLLDAERTLKRLLEHHHRREEMALFDEMRHSLPERVRVSLSRALAETGSAAT